MQKDRRYVNSWTRNVKMELYLVAKQVKKINRDIVGGGCVKDEGKRMETWRRHFERISNEEFGWNRNLPKIDDDDNDDVYLV